MQAAVNKAYIGNIIGTMIEAQDRTFSVEDLDALIEYFSRERLAGYFILVRKQLHEDVRKQEALRLYARNTEISEALYGVIQAFEVTLRNAIHNKLTRSLSENWMDNFALFDSERNAIETAKKAVAERGAQLTTGRIVAELNFGFWVRLFSPQYADTLWGPYLSKIVPLKISRSTAQNRLVDLKTLRNRIAHHNRIIGQGKKVRTLHSELLETLGWFSPVVKAWVEATSCFEARMLPQAANNSASGMPEASPAP